MSSSKKYLLDRWASGRIITDKKVLAAFEKIPREEFLPKHLKPHAYEDRALPILQGQTISQPTTVMLMTQALDVQANHKVLEIGTGSGYQAAILSELIKPKGYVYSTEIIKAVYEYGKKNLEKYKNVAVLFNDGSAGAEAHAPYDRIIITAACSSIPPPLITQLKGKGIIVAPVGIPYEQKMIVGVKKGKNLETHSIGLFVFVPLTGKYGVRR